MTRADALDPTSVTDNVTTDYTAVPLSERAPRQPNPFDSVTPPPVQGPLISPCSAFMILLLLARVIFGIVMAESTLTSLLFAFVAIIPTALVAWWAVRAFRDGSLPNPFLVSQFLLGAVPLVILASLVEGIFLLVSILPVAVFLPKEAWDKIKSLPKITDESVASEAFEAIMADIKKVPLWAIILTIFLASYLVAGTVEEVGKWLFARRYQKPIRDAAATGKHVGARAILASAAMVALGFATTENIGYVLSTGKPEKGFPLIMVGLALLRGILAFPVHVGTQLHVAVAAAHRDVFRDGTRVSVALVHAILFHGTFDAVAFTSMALMALSKIPTWTLFLVPAIDLFLVGILMLLVRARYTSLLERERVAMGAIV